MNGAALGASVVGYRVTTTITRSPLTSSGCVSSAITARTGRGDRAISVNEKKVDAYALFQRRHIPFYVASVGINQAAVLFGACIPYGSLLVGQQYWGTYGWVVENVQAYARTIVATAQVDVQIGAVSVLTGLLTPSGGNAPGAFGTLVAPALRRGKLTDQLNLRITTNGTGTLTDLTVTVIIRPFPAGGEVA